MNSQEKMPDPARFAGTAKKLVALALKAGAEAAEAVVMQSRSVDVAVRDGALEDVQSAESQDLGLRVLMGKRQAGVSSSDLSANSLQTLAERACAMAKAAPEDPWCGLADAALLALQHPDLDLCDPAAPDISQLEQRARATEAAALAVRDVSKSGGAGAGWGVSTACVYASNGLAAARRATAHDCSVMVLGEKDGAMERDWAQSNARWAEDLRTPEAVGREAGERTAARLGAIRLASASLPVLFEPRTARALLGMFLGAISGPGVARGVSFLKDKMGAPVFAPGVDIVEQPLRLRGLGSSAVDGEGLARQSRHLVKGGQLTIWLHNLASARQMDAAPTGHGALSLGSPPGVATTNVHIAPGEQTPAQLMAAMGRGILVTDAFGPSFNGGTGDWSVGIAGYEIAGGEKRAPVNEMTVAGNLADVFARLIPASDLHMRQRHNTPSLLVEGLAVAGL